MKPGWVTKPIEEFARTSAGGTPAKSQKSFYDGGTIPWLLSGEVGNRDIAVAQNFITEAGLKGSSAKLFPPNSVLVAMYGATAGEVGILRFEAATNQAVCAVLPNEQYVPEYLYYFLLLAKGQLVAQAVGNAQPNISQAKIRALPIPLPPLDEQKRIVAVLDEAFEGFSRARANAEANLADARGLFDGTLADAFGSKSWPTKFLHEISDNLDRERVPITKGDRVAGNVPYYGASGVVDHVEDFLFDEELLLVSEDGANLLARTYPIAFSIYGKSWVNNHAHVLRFSDADMREFVRLYLNSISLDPYVSGMAQPKLNQAQLNRIPIPFPDAFERSELVTKAQIISTETAALEQRYVAEIEDLETLRKSLLQKAFSGELT